MVTKKVVKIATQATPEPFTVETARAMRASRIIPSNIEEVMESKYIPQLRAELRDHPEDKSMGLWVLEEHLDLKPQILREFQKRGFNARRSYNPFSFKNTFIVSVPYSNEEKAQKAEKKPGSISITLFGRTISIATSGGARNWKKWFLIASGVSTLALFIGWYLTFVAATGVAIYAFRRM
jgi:hypothetical protein